MTAINLGLNGLRGWAVWQNTLSLKCFRVYRTGFNLAGGVIREVPVEQSPFNYAAMAKPATPSPIAKPDPSENQGPTTQLGLF